MAFVLGVTYKLLMLSFIMLNVVKLSVVMLSVAMMSDVAHPNVTLYIKCAVESSSCPNTLSIIT